MSESVHSTTTTLVKAMRILARDIQSADGVANAAIYEAADRLEHLYGCLVAVSGDLELASVSLQGDWLGFAKQDVANGLRYDNDGNNAQASAALAEWE